MKTPVLDASLARTQRLQQNLQIDVKRLRHLLWNGHHEKACEALGRITSWAKDAAVLNDPALEARTKRLVARCTELRTYTESNEGALIDYGQRHRAGKPISTSRAEGYLLNPGGWQPVRVGFVG